MTMRRWPTLCATALAVCVLAACGGDGGGANAGAGDVSDAAVQPSGAFKPGDRFAVETPLLTGGSQVSHYVVHGVSPTGELVETDRAGLVAGARVPVLESVDWKGAGTASSADPAREQAKFVNPNTLKPLQVAFYQQLWDAMAEHEGTRDPQAILAEIDDLDARVVDLMDDVAASGVSLPEYLAFYDRLDDMPRFADKPLAELNLREALSDVDRYSIFEEAPPACPPGLTRVVSVSGLSTACRSRNTLVLALSEVRTESDSVASALPEPNLRTLLNGVTISDDLIGRVQTARAAQLDALLKDTLERERQRQDKVAELNAAMVLNGTDDARWRSYCATHPELDCGDTTRRGLGEAMFAKTKAWVDALHSDAQLGNLRVQQMHSRIVADLQEKYETLNNALEYYLAMVTPLR